MSRRYSGRRAFRPAAAKPYDFVPFHDKVERRPVCGHERLLLKPGEPYFTGRLDFTLEALSPIFISSGRYALSEEVGLRAPGGVVRSIYRVRGQPAIPGSSLRGVIRAIVEAVSPSCLTLTRADRNRLPKRLTRRQCMEKYAKSACPACRLFGTTGRIGQVTVDDCLPDGEGVETTLFTMPPLYAPRAQRRRVPAAYLVEGKFKGRKFYYHGHLAQPEQGDQVEAMVQGSRLKGTVHFQNLAADELGLLLFALGLDGSFRLKLGGGKPACYGSFAIHPIQLTLMTEEAFIGKGERVLSNDELSDFIAQQISQAEATGILLPKQQAKLREILAYPSARECPAGAY